MVIYSIAINTERVVFKKAKKAYRDTPRKSNENNAKFEISLITNLLVFSLLE